MESFPLFFRIRATTFISMMMFGFLWLVLLCVEVFTRWSVSDQISRSLMVLFILTNTVTLVMLPILVLVKFRIWLDAARLLLLFVLQVGSAASGTVWSHRIQCPDRTPDDIGVCQLIGVYTMIACWIIPAILVLYSTYFAVVIYLQSRIPVAVESKPHQSRSVDLETSSSNSLSLWREKLKEIVILQSPSTPMSAPPRELILASMTHARQLSLPHSPAPPRHQSTMPSLLHTRDQLLPPIPSIPSRHRSLPAFKHGDQPRLATHIPKLHPSYPRTPHSGSSPIPSSSNSLNQPYSPVMDIHSPEDRLGWSKHLSMMPLLPPREVQSGEGSPATPKRARLSKPVPSHFL